MQKLVIKLFFLAFLIGHVAAKEIPATRAFDVANYAGKVLYLDFWASWCGPCHQSFPVMNDLQREFGDDLVIVGVNVDEQHSDALDFLAIYDPDFEIVFDPEGELAEAFNVPTMPTSFLFDRNGKLVKMHRTFSADMVPAIRDSISEALQ